MLGACANYNISNITNHFVLMHIEVISTSSQDMHTCRLIYVPILTLLSNIDIKPVFFKANFGNVINTRSHSLIQKSYIPKKLYKRWFYKAMTHLLSFIVFW